MLEETEQTGSRTEQMWNGIWIVGLTPLLLRNIRNNGGGCRCFLGWNGSISGTCFVERIRRLGEKVY